MAPDPTVAERAYSEIKRKLLSGHFHLRQKLDALAIAEELGASTTPVREALVRLASERLIASRSLRGYHMALWTEDQLRALYGWRGMLADLASRERQSGLDGPLGGEGIYPERIASLFGRLESDANAEITHAARNADDRLHAARRAEHEIWSDVDAELRALGEALRNPARARRTAAISAYHRRRITHAGAIRERALLMTLPPNGL